MTKEELLQDWLPRLMDALKDVRHKENASAEETLYELYVEMSQQTLAEKMSTFSEITLEDQMSAMAIELLAAQKRVANLELGICQRAFEAKQEQCEPVAWIVHDRVAPDRLTFVEVKQSLQTEVTPLYTTPPQRTWVGLTPEEMHKCYEEAANMEPYMGAITRVNVVKAIEAKLKEKNT